MPTAHPGILPEADWREQKEFVVTSEYAVTFLFVLFLGGLSVAGLYFWIRDLQRDRRYRNRVWCVCYIEGRLGLISQKDYDKASREYWRNARRPGTLWTSYKFGDMIRVPFSRVIVIPAITTSSREFRTLQGGKYLERREFIVPEEITPFPEAYRRLNGKPWDGKYAY